MVHELPAKPISGSVPSRNTPTISYTMAFDRVESVDMDISNSNTPIPEGLDRFEGPNVNINTDPEPLQTINMNKRVLEYEGRHLAPVALNPDLIGQGSGSGSSSRNRTGSLSGGTAGQDMFCPDPRHFQPQANSTAAAPKCRPHDHPPMTNAGTGTIPGVPTGPRLMRAPPPVLSPPPPPLPEQAPPPLPPPPARLLPSHSSDPIPREVASPSTPKSGPHAIHGSSASRTQSQSQSKSARAASSQPESEKCKPSHRSILPADRKPKPAKLYTPPPRPSKGSPERGTKRSRDTEAAPARASTSTGIPSQTGTTEPASSSTAGEGSSEGGIKRSRDTEASTPRTNNGISPYIPAPRAKDNEASTPRTNNGISPYIPAPRAKDNEASTPRTNNGVSPFVPPRVKMAALNKATKRPRDTEASTTQNFTGPYSENKSQRAKLPLPDFVPGFDFSKKVERVRDAKASTPRTSTGLSDQSATTDPSSSSSSAGCEGSLERERKRSRWSDAGSTVGMEGVGKGDKRGTATGDGGGEQEKKGRAEEGAGKEERMQIEDIASSLGVPKTPTGAVAKASKSRESRPSPEQSGKTPGARHNTPTHQRSKSSKDGSRQGSGPVVPPPIAPRPVASVPTLVTPTQGEARQFTPFETSAARQLRRDEEYEKECLARQLSIYEEMLSMANRSCGLGILGAGEGSDSGGGGGGGGAAAAAAAAGKVGGGSDGVRTEREDFGRDRALVDRALAERASAERAMAERVWAERALAEQALAERALAERASAERASADRASAERAMAERVSAERASAERALAERGLADQGVADRGVADRGVADRGVADRGVADRGVADRGVADRGVADRGVADRSLANRGLADLWKKFEEMESTNRTLVERCERSEQALAELKKHSWKAEESDDRVALRLATEPRSKVEASQPASVGRPTSDLYEKVTERPATQGDIEDARKFAMSECRKMAIFVQNAVGPMHRPPPLTTSNNSEELVKAYWSSPITITPRSFSPISPSDDRLMEEVTKLKQIVVKLAPRMQRLEGCLQECRETSDLTKTLLREVQTEKAEILKKTGEVKAVHGEIEKIRDGLEARCEEFGVEFRSQSASNSAMVRKYLTELEGASAKLGCLADSKEDLEKRFSGFKTEANSRIESNTDLVLKCHTEVQEVKKQAEDRHLGNQKRWDDFEKMGKPHLQTFIMSKIKEGISSYYDMVLRPKLDTRESDLLARVDGKLKSAGASKPPLIEHRPDNETGPLNEQAPVTSDPRRRTSGPSSNDTKKKPGPNPIDSPQAGEAKARSFSLPVPESSTQLPAHRSTSVQSHSAETSGDQTQGLGKEGMTEQRHKEQIIHFLKEVTWDKKQIRKAIDDAITKHERQYREGTRKEGSCKPDDRDRDRPEYSETSRRTNIRVYEDDRGEHTRQQPCKPLAPDEALASHDGNIASRHARSPSVSSVPAKAHQMNAANTPTLPDLKLLTDRVEGLEAAVKVCTPPSPDLKLLTDRVEGLEASTEKQRSIKEDDAADAKLQDIESRLAIVHERVESVEKGNSIALSVWSTSLLQDLGIKLEAISSDKEDVASTKSRLQELDGSLSDLQKRVTLVEKECDAVKTSQAGTEESVKFVSGKTQKLSSASAEASEKLQQIGTNFAALQEKVDLVSKETGSISAAQEALRSSAKTLSDRMQSLSSAAEETKSTVSKLNVLDSGFGDLQKKVDGIEKVSNSFQAISKTVADLSSGAAKTSEGLKGLRESVKAARQKVKELEGASKTMSTAQTACNHSLALVEQKLARLSAQAGSSTATLPARDASTPQGSLPTEYDIQLLLLTGGIRDLQQWKETVEPRLKTTEDSIEGLQLYVSSVENLYKEDVSSRLSDPGVLDSLVGKPLSQVASTKLELLIREWETAKKGEEESAAEKDRLEVRGSIAKVEKRLNLVEDVIADKWSRRDARQPGCRQFFAPSEVTVQS